MLRGFHGAVDDWTSTWMTPSAARAVAFRLSTVSFILYCHTLSLLDLIRAGRTRRLAVRAPRSPATADTGHRVTSAAEPWRTSTASTGRAAQGPARLGAEWHDECVVSHDVTWAQFRDWSRCGGARDRVAVPERRSPLMLGQYRSVFMYEPLQDCNAF